MNKKFKVTKWGVVTELRVDDSTTARSTVPRLTNITDMVMYLKGRDVRWPAGMLVNVTACITPEIIALKIY